MSNPPNEQYKGWRVWSLKNPWLKLHIAPQLGGRIIQLELNNYDFLFVNPALEGKEPGESRLSEQGTWLNFGGEKIWPAPQGWNSPELWPGPPDPVLDSGVYTVTETEFGRYLQLRSPEDPYTGLQITKRITMSQKRSEVRIEATFTNKSQIEREWSIWPVLQMNTPDFHSGDRYQVTCPVNPDSCFSGGFHVMHGIANNPQNKLNEAGNLEVNYQYLVGKVGLDSTANWLAFCDRKVGKVFMVSYQHQPQGVYPEDTSVQIWTQGRGMIYSRNRIVEFPNDRAENPPYLELELLSPLQKIQPGQQTQFNYKISVCSIAKGSSVQQVNEHAVIAKPLIAVRSGSSICITGQFGVFSQGRVRLRFEDADGEPIDATPIDSWPVSPFSDFTLSLETTQDKQIQKQVARLALDLCDEDGLFIGELTQTTVWDN